MLLCKSRKEASSVYVPSKPLAILERESNRKYAAARWDLRATRLNAGARLQSGRRGRNRAERGIRVQAALEIDVQCGVRISRVEMIQGVERDPPTCS